MTSWRRLSTILLGIAFGGTALAQNAPALPPDQKAIDAAIEKGIQFLRKAPSPDFDGNYKNSDELILWTFVHGAASLLIDQDYEGVAPQMDVNRLIEAATPSLLTPAPLPARPKGKRPGR